MQQSQTTTQHKSTDNQQGVSGANASRSLPAVPVLQKVVPEEELIQTKPNNTGLPDNLKSGVENLSGFSLDDVKVHYNSAKPAQLQALAYAQGTDIHVAPGQERHLPHEAWHIVQQKQGRVQPTMQMKESMAINDDKGLESEADVMGEKAVQMKVEENKGRAETYSIGQDKCNGTQGCRFVDNPYIDSARRNFQYIGNSNINAKPLESADGLIGGSVCDTTVSPTQRSIIQMRSLVRDTLNIVGENHGESGKRRYTEEDYCKLVVRGFYFLEHQMPGGMSTLDPNSIDSADPRIQRFVFIASDILRKLRSLPRKQRRLTKLDVCTQSLLLHARGLFLIPSEIAKVAEIIGAVRLVLNKAERVNLGEFPKYQEITNALDLLNTLRTRPEMTECEERSESMYQSFKILSRAGYVGVWKVGDQHITDIRRAHPEAYILTTDQAEFNTKYLPYDRFVEKQAERRLEADLRHCEWCDWSGGYD